MDQKDACYNNLMGVLILTGPPATGKNTIAAVYARRHERCAVIDVDLVRWMVLQPHKAPWEGEEGRKQQHLGVENACLLARNFLTHDFDVVILDVVSDETVRLYRRALPVTPLQVVLLLPSYEEIQRRNEQRPQRLTADEILTLYRGQESLKDYDHRVNNTALSPEQVAEHLAGL